MKGLPIILGVIIWILLFIVVYSIGSRIIELQRNSAKKKWGIEEHDYDHEKMDI